MADKNTFSIADFLGRAITVYKENFMPLINFSCAASVPVILRVLMQSSGDAGISALGQILGPLVFALYIFFFMCLVWAAANILQGQSISSKDIMAYVWARFWRSLGAYIVFAAIVFVGMILLIVPGVYCLTIFMFYPFVILMEDQKLVDAFKRSQDLVKDHFWLVLKANGVSLLVSVGLFVPFFLGLWMMGAGEMAVMLVMGILGTLTAPVFVIFYYYIYEFLKTDKDGVLNISVRQS